MKKPGRAALFTAAALVSQIGGGSVEQSSLQTEQARPPVAATPTEQAIGNVATTTTTEAPQPRTTVHPIDIYLPQGSSEISTVPMPESAINELGVIGAWVMTKGGVNVEGAGSFAGVKLPREAPDLFDPEGPYGAAYDAGAIGEDGRRYVQHSFNTQGPLLTVVDRGRATVIEADTDLLIAAANPSGVTVSFKLHNNTLTLSAPDTLEQESLHIAVINGAGLIDGDESSADIPY